MQVIRAEHNIDINQTKSIDNSYQQFITAGAKRLSPIVDLGRARLEKPIESFN